MSWLERGQAYKSEIDAVVICSSGRHGQNLELPGMTCMAAIQRPKSANNQVKSEKNHI